MKRSVLHIILIALVVCCFSSCHSKDGKIIPRATLSKIYADVFVADAWLSMASSEDKYMADTTAFYEPVFEKYGYSTEDYLRSVEYYLNDPERFSRILKKTRLQLQSDIKGFQDALDVEHREQQAANERENMIKDSLLFYSEMLRSSFFTDVIEMERNEKGVYVPSVIQEDTSFRGPSIILRKDTVEVVSERPVYKIEASPIRRHQ